MKKVDRLIKKLQDARAKDLRTNPVRLSKFHTHYSTTKTRSEQAVQNIERINRKQPIKITKADGTVITKFADGSEFNHTEQLWNE